MTASKSMSIMNTIILLAPNLITVAISELVSNRKTCSLKLLDIRGSSNKGWQYSLRQCKWGCSNEQCDNASFSRIAYHLSSPLIESLNYPGQATTMLGLLKYPDDFSKAHGLNQLWYKDTATTAAKLIIIDLLQGLHISSSHQPSKVHFLLEFRWHTSLVLVRTTTKLCMVWNTA